MELNRMSAREFHTSSERWFSRCRIFFLAWQWFATLLGTGIFVSAVGCNRGPEMAAVTGKVTYNGQPLQFGSVTFQPTRGQPARGEIQSDGSFELSTFSLGDGAFVGPHKVKIACYESQNPAFVKGPGEQRLGRSLIPVKYTLLDQSGLTAEVKPDTAEPIVFDLTGPAAPAR
jgi:hypothetical protein